ncbi:hypothetical protein CWI84_03920 [Idiomarina tyrosinivorans]|uniref:DUF418 domain-containing protein n=1 Tax=Idiomarina tyrosinivorans TaxID=1445662 RepID=A0A432ZSC8_9GAMM|nr:DUF418 domain-containing protein [Idiomarina tyrosinivorans]RUO80741.1 hypothetical protein CWI84_03920 [Idiomarina tyrosinivorans]
MNTQSQTLTQIPPSERITLIDTIRGFALLGILLVNMVAFQKTPFAEHVYGLNDTSSIGLALTWIEDLLIQGKFYTLFSMLFGFGFAIFMQRAQAKGASPRWRFLRRTVGLLIIGFAHAVLLWGGDILMSYAITALLLLFFKNTKPKRLLVIATVLVSLMLLAIWIGVIFAGQGPADEGAESFSAMAAGLVADAETIYRSGSFWQVTAFRLKEWLAFFPTILNGLPIYLANFLIGTALARSGIFSDVKGNQTFFKKAAIRGLLLGLPLAAFFASFAHQEVMNDKGLSVLQGAAINAQFISNIALALAYIGLWGWLSHSDNGLAQRLAQVGRLGLSNYLLQSLIFTTFFYGYGFGFYGQFAHWQLTLMAVACFLLQILLSGWYLQRFQQGPLEYLWRRFTYGLRS